jgi:Oxidoreductase molybdopterin binding domain
MRSTSGHDNERVGQSPSVGLIIRQKEPKNLETPMDRVDSFLTPTELFYIRSHFPTPWLDLASYRLEIDGAVQQPISLSYEELRRMPFPHSMVQGELGPLPPPRFRPRGDATIPRIPAT